MTWTEPIQRERCQNLNGISILYARAFGCCTTVSAPSARGTNYIGEPA